MRQLSKDWITDHVIDSEYKKYILLAWLQDVEKSFRAVKLYPPLSDLLEHYRRTKELLENKSSLESAFPKKLTGFDTERIAANFESTVREEQTWSELNRIIEFSLPKFEQWLNEGKQIYEFLESTIHMESIGIVPIHMNEGYLLLRDAEPATRVYSYSITLFEEAGASYRGIHTSFVTNFTTSLQHSYENIKHQLITLFPSFPNPAVYAAETELHLPLAESFLPIAKRMLVREVSGMYKK